MARHHSPQFLALVEDAKGRIREISARDLKGKLDGGENFHLIDVREAEVWAAGHLPRAQHLCKGILERDIETTVIAAAVSGRRSGPITCRKWDTGASCHSPVAGAADGKQVTPPKFDPKTLPSIPHPSLGSTRTDDSPPHR